MATDEALISKADAEAQMVKAEQHLTMVTFKLKTAEANAELAQKKAT